MGSAFLKGMFGALLLGLPVALDAAGPVRAAEAVTADPATAARLAAELNAASCQPFANFSVSLQCQWQGQIRVVPAGDHYQAEVPELVAQLSGGRRAALGTVRLDLWPESGGALEFALTLPTALELVDKAGKPDMSVALGSQRIEGRWDATVHSVTRLTADARDLRLTSRTDGHVITIGTASLTESLSESQPGRWSGPAALALSKIALRTTGGADLLSLESAALDGRVSGLDLPLAIARHAQSQAAAPEPAPPVAPGPAKPGVVAPLVKHGLWTSARRYLTRLHDLFDGVSVGIHLSGLTMKIPMADTTVALGRFEYQTTVDGLEHGVSSLAVTYEHGPLAVTPAPSLQEFLPKAARFSLTAGGLPNAGLWQALEHALPADGAKGDQVFKVFLSDADDALTKAGAHLAIETLGIDTPATTVKLTGKAQYDAGAAMGMVAQYDMIIRGFDAALKALQPAPGSSDLGDGAKNILSVLTMVQVMGLPAKDETGRDARTYKVDIAKTGGIMLNGADITILVQGLKERLGRHAQPAPAGAPK